jgi:hypothetical protein
MTIPNDPTTTQPRDAGNWAAPTDRLEVKSMPAEAMNANVHGRQPMSPLQGFGQMWQKTYRVRLTGTSATPQEVIKVWKENFPKFWPKGNHFYAPLAGIAPGEVALINATVPGGIKLSTGVSILYADDESFTFMTPIGHIFAGWVMFSAFEEEGSTVAQAQVLIRANDPMMEIGFRLGIMHAKEDEIWHHTLKSLASEFGVTANVQQQVTCVDPRVQWSEAGNIKYNMIIRSMLYTLGTPVRWATGLFART